MAHFDAIETMPNERFDSRSRARAARMRQNRQAARIVNHCDRVRHREAVLRNEGGFTIPEIPIEGVTQIVGPPVVYEGARNMGTANRAASRLRKDIFEGDLHAELVETTDDSLGTRQAHRAQVTETVADALDVAQMQSEQMRLCFTLDGTEFDARHDTDAQEVPFLARLGESINGVVIRQRYRHQSEFARGAHDIAW
jgi:hypothetical protein